MRGEPLDDGVLRAQPVEVDLPQQGRRGPGPACVLGGLQAQVGWGILPLAGMPGGVHRGAGLRESHDVEPLLADLLGRRAGQLRPESLVGADQQQVPVKGEVVHVCPVLSRGDRAGGVR